MDKVCKKYISNIKTLFPIMGKQEKAYIKKLCLTIDEYCCETSCTTAEELYTNFGRPEDVLNTYLQYTDTQYLIKRLNIARFIKLCLIILIVCCIVVTTIFAIYVRDSYNIARESQIYSIETIIE